ncbi:MAG: hypothetical protein R3B46_07145 [Phycisphaerales bacterium]
MSKRWLFGGLMLALAAAAPIFSLAPAAHARPEMRAGDDAPKMVELVMTDGRVIKAQILSETATEYRVLAFLMEGFPAVETTYRKSAVQEVRALESDAADSADTAPATKTNDDAKKNTSNAKDADKAAQIILTRVDGEIGFDFSPTPLRKFFTLVDETFNDLDDRGDVVTDHRKDHIVIFYFNTQTYEAGGIDGLFSIMDIKEILQDEMKKGRRIVFWVERAVNGAAVLPMMSPEIFFTDNGDMLVTKDLDKFGQGGDDVVIEKQISLRLGHAEGFPILGGYTDVGPQIVRAMLRSPYEFWYKKVGGKVIAINDPPPADDIENWIQLSDDGKGENQDKLGEDDNLFVIGNDRLWLDAARAYDLGIAKAICNTTDDIAFHLGVGRNYKLMLEDGGAEVFQRWSRELDRALRQISQGGNGRPRGELWKQFDKAGELNGIQAQLGRRKNSLEKIVGILRKYQEVFDPEGQSIAQLNVQIELLRQQIMQANAQN